MSTTATTLYIFALILNVPILCLSSSISCPAGRDCPANWTCCEQGCCAPASTPDSPHRNIIYPWYAQGPILYMFGTVGCILVFGLWCLCFKKPFIPTGIYSYTVYSFSCCVRRRPSNHDSAGSIYLPPRYSRCGSFHQAPPPYSEVTSKPDLYPLVITCGEGEAKAGSNYLMVHYFNNYVIRAPGSLSAASTAESLSSSVNGNATNEANTMIPPPYGGLECAGSCVTRHSSTSLPAPRPRRIRPTRTTENIMSSPVQPMESPYDLELDMMDCEYYCNSGRKPRVGHSPPIHRSPSNNDDSLYDREAYGLRHMTRPSSDGIRSCESPPQPTSPTQSRDSTLHRHDESRQRRLDTIKKSLKTRKSSLYMQLSLAYPVRSSRISPGARASSRSAPATPCGVLVPNILNFTQRVSSRHGSRPSRFDEESNPLLSDIESRSDPDHKF